MAVILETLSLRSLIAFAFLLLGILIVFFVTGGKIAPAPTTASSHLANICVGNLSKLDSFYDPTTCSRLDSIKQAMTDPRHIRADQIVFAIRFPHPGLYMSRWFQFLSTSIRLEIEYNKFHKYENKDGVLPTLEFYTHLGYRRKGEDSWKLYHKGHENRSLDCKFFQSTVGKFIGKSVFQTSDRIKKLQYNKKINVLILYKCVVWLCLFLCVCIFFLFFFFFWGGGGGGVTFFFGNSVSTNAKHVFLRTNQNEIGSRLTGARSVLLDLDLSLYWCLISVREAINFTILSTQSGPPK
ncbi:unnamed protein product [Porites evermanni]|uniref:Wntless GOLD domain-containing protein n=1 Tax=Porites evermanni TaxID=104178 RepID=A0ABN8MH51_9CNID|nr:unnamed protein product [Porites evermanni]